jgi:uncharacterized protein (DUF4415 family)
MTDDEIDFSDCPEITPEMFATAVVRRGALPITRKTQVTLRVDSDVLGWFRGRGRGYQTRINSLLRAYVDVQRSHEAKGARNTGPVTVGSSGR